MKRAFTLVELLVVIIILSVLATLGFQQYSRVVEKSRSSEARMILGQIRDTARAYYDEWRSLELFDNAAAGIGTDSDSIPEMDAPRPSHYFTYNIQAKGVTYFQAAAYRNQGPGGKNPPYAPGGSVVLTCDFGAVAPFDQFSYTAAYQ